GRNRKTVFTIHSSEYGRCGNVFHDGRSAVVREHERAGTYWADHVITVSQSLKNEIMWMYEVPDWKASVVYNGVNVHHWDGWIDPASVKQKYEIAPMAPMILFVGRMVYQKGPDLLVGAIPFILDYYPDATFVFAGDGEMRMFVEDRARQLNVFDATRFVGFKTGWELVDLYKACDVVCVPSRNEPFGIVVLEGWSAGKPVIATVNGGPNEYLWHEVNGLKIHPTPDSAAWGLGTLFTDFERARWMGENGRIAVEKGFTWDVISDRMLSAIQTPIN
ncbi:MAG: glycosyltransferase family 4 protein, partial [bacterium]|nr:glycosyltransferase family 4 protein [bacterium]